MRTVITLAIAALAALIVALITGSTWPALAVVALAGAGIVLLLRDWRAERSSAQHPALDRSASEPVSEPVEHHADPHADDLSPDISTDPNGPSSDARSDQL
ncbi:MAG: hypothetical protein FGM50_01525 [Mycobacterium sp.]|nr:hypothetical protein [Mycobacterium sp.]